MPDDSLANLIALNESSVFNQWAGMTVTSASVGRVELGLPWRADFAEYRGILHAALVLGLLETACGFAADTTRPTDGVCNCSVNFLSPAFGDSFVARAHVIKSGRRQIFTAAELFAVRDGAEHLVTTATGISTASP